MEFLIIFGFLFFGFCVLELWQANKRLNGILEIERKKSAWLQQESNEAQKAKINLADFESEC